MSESDGKKTGSALFNAFIELDCDLGMASCGRFAAAAHVDPRPHSCRSVEPFEQLRGLLSTTGRFCYVAGSDGVGI